MPGVTMNSRRVGAWAALVLVGGSVALGFAHAGALVNYAYPVVALAIAFLLLRRDRYLDYLEFTVWLWLVDPGVRRIVDYGSVYHSTSPVSITADLVCILGLYRAFAWRGQVFREARAAICVIGVIVGYGFLVGVVHAHELGAAVDVAFYGGPLSLGIFLLTAPIDRHDLLYRLSQIAVPALILLGGYGIAQFIYPTPWDVAWIQDSGITAIGGAESFQLRVFSLLDSPGPFGQTMTVLLLLAMQPLARQSWWRRLAIGLGLVGLGLSLARAAWIALGIGILILILCRRLAFGRLAGAVVAVGLLVGVFGGPVRDAITGRFTNTVQAGGSDTSFSARVSFQAKIAPSALHNIGGQGLGAAGVGTKLSGGSDSATSDLISSFDSGIFEIIFAFGSGPGIVFLVVVVRLAGRLGRRHLRRGPPDSAFAAAALIGLVSALIFTNVMKSVYGADFWLLVAAIGAPSRTRDSEAVDDASAPVAIDPA